MERAFSAMRLPESVREGNVKCSGPIMICQKTLPAVGLPSLCLLSTVIGWKKNMSSMASELMWYAENTALGPICQPCSPQQEQYTP